MLIINVFFFSSPSNVFLGELSHPDAYNLEYIGNCMWYPRHLLESQAVICNITFIIQSQGMKQRLKHPHHAPCLR